MIALSKVSVSDGNILKRTSRTSTQVDHGPHWVYERDTLHSIHADPSEQQVERQQDESNKQLTPFNPKYF